MEEVLKLYTGMMKSSALSIVIKYEIPKHIELNQGKINSFELAKKLNLNGEYLYRLMRSLSCDGIFIEDETHTFKNSNISKLLIDDNGILNHAKMALHPKLMESWLHLEDSIKSGQSEGFHSIGYNNLWSFANENEDFKMNFMKAMSFQTQQNNKILYELKDEIMNSNVKNVCDIGGSTGKLLSDLLGIYPTIEKAINFDLSMTINSELTQGFIKSLPPTITSKLELKSGDFFNASTIPENVDLYIMKRAIHDWSNEKSILILNNIYDKMKSDSYLILLEGIIPGKNKPNYLSTFDLLNLHIVGGEERTMEQWNELISMSKFKSITNVQSYNGNFGISKIVLKK